MRRMLTLMSACAMLAIAACGGKVVVDVGASGVVGGGGGVFSGGTAGSNSGSGLNGAGGASCLAPPDPSTLTFCGGSVGAGGSTMQCENDFCDSKGNMWAAACTNTTCQCKFNSQVVCTCALNGPGNFCLGTPSCCPLPMPGGK